MHAHNCRWVDAIQSMEARGFWTEVLIVSSYPWGQALGIFLFFFVFGCGGRLGKGNTIIAVTSQHIFVKYFEGGYIIASLSFILIDGVENLSSWKSCKPSKHEVYKCISQNLRRRPILGKTWRCKDVKTWGTRCCHPQELDWDVHSRLPTVSLPTTSQERWCVKKLGFEDVRKWDVVT